MERRLEDPLTYYTVENDGTLIWHTMRQMELPFGPSDPKRVATIRQVEATDGKSDS